MLRPPRRRSAGQAAAQYLVSLVVFIICGVMLSNYSNLPNRLRAFYNPRTSTDIVRVDTNQKRIIVTPYRGSVLDTEEGLTEFLGDVEILTINSAWYTLENYPVNPSRLAQSKGAHVVSRYLLDALEALIKGMKAKNELNGDRLKTLEALVVQGRHLETIERHVETAAASTETSEQFRAWRVDMSGRNRTMAQLTSLIGYKDQMFYLREKGPFSKELKARQETEKLVDAYIAVKESGALKDLAMEQFVRSTVIHLLHLSEGVEAASDRIAFDPKLKPGIYREVLYKEVVIFDYCFNGRGQEDELFYCPKDIARRPGE